MQRPHITQVPGLWERDGSLRDVYFFGSDLESWSKFIDYASSYRFTYQADGKATEFPGVREVFRMRDTSHCLSIWIGDACANCHFFLADEIELDLDPREVLGPQEHDALLAFVEGAANAVGLNGTITPEGSEDSPILWFEINNQCWKTHG